MTFAYVVSKRVTIHSSGDQLWSPNSKDDLCKAIQELTAEVERLRNEAEEATSEVSWLKDRLALLRTRLAHAEPDGAA